jgi:ComF family protein
MHLWRAAAQIVDEAGGFLGRVVSPPRCAACDVEVRARVVFCRECASTVTWAPRKGAWPLAAFDYGGAIADSVTRFKYGGRPDLARPLGDLLWRAVEPTVSDFASSRVVPVPLHPSRLAERGYNQAALLAGRLARRLGRPFLPLALARTRDTPKQAALGRGDRLVNVAGAFVVRQPLRVVAGEVLLVDDVSTTGATLRACETALLQAGASRVAFLVLARAA